MAGAEDFSFEDVVELLRKQTGKDGVLQDGIVDLHLDEGQSAWHPASTKRSLWGPCVVRYEFHSDGGVNAHILDA